MLSETVVCIRIYMQAAHEKGSVNRNLVAQHVNTYLPPHRDRMADSELHMSALSYSS